MNQLDLESCTDQTDKMQDLSENCCSEEANKPKIEPPLSPSTPDAHKENGEFPLDLKSPLTVVKKSSKVLTFDSKSDRVQEPSACFDKSSSPKTPKDGVFDPFAPGPEDKVWAPQSKKYSEEARSNAVRRLNFSSSFKGFDSKVGSCDEEESISDAEMFESVYESLLEAILSKQTESVLAEQSANMESEAVLSKQTEMIVAEQSTNMESDSDSDACKTPPSAPRLTGIADTCPGAPMKPTGNSRIFDFGLCRKLEF
ncbi:uncharacterized protein LOC126664708 [Mercurialis annua]|uniref:uncharacterized protein LOC126664708 n=1 Tax=Mercurialis annua TaxID=3986 RepID=UPI00215FF240|nr:uncharacterized protein LOC126664708 [Mercurialis annua]